MRMTRREQHGERGFALVETLIATAILAVMLGTTFQILSTTSRATMTQRDQRRAALFAASVMARVGTDIALAPGVTGGTSDGLDWRVEIDRFRATGAEDVPESTRLLRVYVSVAPSAEKGSVQLHSLRFVQ